MLQDEFILLGKHIAAGATFSSNFTLWKEAGYFDSSAETKPLLHLWSLGIEEQFYLIWPLLLWGAWRVRVNLFIVVLSVAILSFSMNLREVHQDAIATFYSPQTRFWELLAGSLLSYGMLYAKSPRFFDNNQIAKRLSNFISLIGILLLLVGACFIRKGVPFPGWLALMPVLAAMLLILAGPDAWCNRKILSNKVLVWFGLISFPLYLWHWPLLSFARIVQSETPSFTIRAMAVLISVILGWLTFSFVEKPIRYSNHKLLSAQTLCVCLGVVGIIGFFVYKGNFYSDLINKQVNEKLDIVEYAQRCNQGTINPIIVSGCLLQKDDGKNTIALIGDSHAGHLFSGLSQRVASSDGVALFNFNCAAPFINVSTGVSSDKTVRENSYKSINKALEYAANQENIDTVVLAHHPECSYKDAIDKSNPSKLIFKDVISDGLRRTLDYLVGKSKNVVIVLDNPTLPIDPKQCVNRPFRIELKDNQCSFSREIFDRDSAVVEYNNIVKSVLKDFPEVAVVDLSEDLCDKETCYLSKGGKLLYEDGSHLSYSGSKFVAPSIINAVQRARGNI